MLTLVLLVLAAVIAGVLIGAVFGVVWMLLTGAYELFDVLF